jgi:hypothetical protein
MRLDRLTSNYMHAHGADSDEYAVSDDKNLAYIYFQKFGAGSERFSDFKVTFVWADIEAIVQKFADHGHPEAKRLVCAKKLAIAVEELVRNSN